MSRVEAPAAFVSRASFDQLSMRQYSSGTIANRERRGESCELEDY